MKEENKNQWESTDEMRLVQETITQLEKFLPKILGQSFWQRKVSVSEKITFLNILSENKAKLWKLVYSKYPETVGKDLSFGQKFIKEI